MAQGNKPRWTPRGIKNGIEEIHIRKWKYFVTYVQEEFKNVHDFIFRGHRKDTYRLESTLDRQIPNKAQAEAIRGRQLRKFKLAIRGKRGVSPADYADENEWWALGQHFGLMTPLLDWTYSPFVAAYFAFLETAQDDTKKRTIWALNKKRVEATPDAHLKFFVPTSSENARVLNQNGLFTVLDEATTIEDWVEQQFKDSSDRILIKFVLPNEERETSLTGLELMSINHLTLFPDLYGASVYVNAQMQHLAEE